MESVKENFRGLDIFIFAGVISLSAVVGLIFAVKDRKKQSMENYYFGGRNVSSIPVAISLTVSFISAITVIGAPAEVYLHGSILAWHFISAAIANMAAIAYYVPLYHRLRLNSVYEYLELRFHRRIKIFISFAGIAHLITYLAFAVYIPSLALSAVTPLELSWTIALTTITCTFYSSLGGMKAVIWVDVIQSFVMIAGMAAVLVQTLVDVGGVERVFAAAERGGRNNVFEFDLDPRIRSTVWTITVGSAVLISYETLCGQIFVQRWLACKNTKSARRAIGTNIVLLVLIYVLSIGTGLSAYAYYEGCDPLMSGRISKSDQLIPILAVDIFANAPGMVGLFVSATFCGALSTVSSGLNSLAAVSSMDYIISTFPNLTSRAKVLLSKALTVFFGAVVMTFAYLISLSSHNVFALCSGAVGCIGGPVLSIFTMGIFMPWINGKGAFIGCLFGWAFSFWIGFSAILFSVRFEGSKTLISSTESCNFTFPVERQFNSSQSQNFTQTETLAAPHTVEHADPSRNFLHSTLYAVSIYYYASIGFTVSIIAGHVAGIFTGFNHPSKANPDLFVPIADGHYLPEGVRKFFRFGVPVPRRSESAPAKSGCGEEKYPFTIAPTETDKD